jgi:hypothetical protein
MVVWGEVSMCGGYLPHIINCSFVGFALTTELETKEPARTVRGLVADALLA